MLMYNYNLYIYYLYILVFTNVKLRDFNRIINVVVVVARHFSSKLLIIVYDSLYFGFVQKYCSTARRARPQSHGDSRNKYI